MKIKIIITFILGILLGIGLMMFLTKNFSEIDSIELDGITYENQGTAVSEDGNSAIILFLKK